MSSRRNNQTVGELPSRRNVSFFTLEMHFVVAATISFHISVVMACDGLLE